MVDNKVEYTYFMQTKDGKRRFGMGGDRYDNRVWFEGAFYGDFWNDTIVEAKVDLDSQSFDFWEHVKDPPKPDEVMYLLVERSVTYKILYEES